MAKKVQLTDDIFKIELPGSGAYLILGSTIENLLEMKADILCPAHGNPVPFSKSARKKLKEVKACYAERKRD